MAGDGIKYDAAPINTHSIRKTSVRTNQSFASLELRKNAKPQREKRSPTKIASGDVAWF
jgi:hypothetical protein